VSNILTRLGALTFGRFISAREGWRDLGLVQWRHEPAWRGSPQGSAAATL
jgi:hypothetical protein